MTLALERNGRDAPRARCERGNTAEFTGGSRAYPMVRSLGRHAGLEMATMQETRRAHDTSAPPVSQANLLEYSGIAVLSLAAWLVRAWKLRALGLSHFDEGVYANSGFWALHSFFGPGLDPWQ